MLNGKENQNGLLPVVHRDNQALVDSRIVAEYLGLDHRNWRDATLYGNLEVIEENFSRVQFENAPFETAGGMQMVKYALLTEDQALFVATLSRNTPQVVAFKVALVKTFQALRQAPRPLPLAEKTLIASVQFQGETFYHGNAVKRALGLSVRSSWSRPRAIYEVCFFKNPMDGAQYINFDYATLLIDNKAVRDMRAALKARCLELASNQMDLFTLNEPAV